MKFLCITSIMPCLLTVLFLKTQASGKSTFHDYGSSRFQAEIAGTYASIHDSFSEVYSMDQRLKSNTERGCKGNERNSTTTLFNMNESLLEKYERELVPTVAQHFRNFIEFVPKTAVKVFNKTSLYYYSPEMNPIKERKCQMGQSARSLAKNSLLSDLIRIMGQGPDQGLKFFGKNKKFDLFQAVSLTASHGKRPKPVKIHNIQPYLCLDPRHFIYDGEYDWPRTSRRARIMQAVRAVSLVYENALCLEASYDDHECFKEYMCYWFPDCQYSEFSFTLEHFKPFIPEHLRQLSTVTLTSVTLTSKMSETVGLGLYSAQEVVFDAKITCQCAYVSENCYTHIKFDYPVFVFYLNKRFAQDITGPSDRKQENVREKVTIFVDNDNLKDEDMVLFKYLSYHPPSLDASCFHPRCLCEGWAVIKPVEYRQKLLEPLFTSMSQCRSLALDILFSSSQAPQVVQNLSRLVSNQTISYQLLMDIWPWQLERFSIQTDDGTDTNSSGMIADLLRKHRRGNQQQPLHLVKPESLLYKEIDHAGVYSGIQSPSLLYLNTSHFRGVEKDEDGKIIFVHHQLICFKEKAMCTSLPTIPIQAHILFFNTSFPWQKFKADEKNASKEYATSMFLHTLTRSSPEIFIYALDRNWLRKFKIDSSAFKWPNWWKVKQGDILGICHLKIIEAPFDGFIFEECLIGLYEEDLEAEATWVNPKVCKPSKNVKKKKKKKKDTLAMYLPK